MSIFIKGDTHGDFYELVRFNKLMSELTKDDYMIICGDFGCIWNYKGEDSKERLNKEKLDNLNFTTLFVDGNHESYSRLYSEFPIVDFKGGKAHKVTDSIYHLMRGEMFNIDDKRIFTFGGARSHDIENLINPSFSDYEEKRDYLDRKWEFYREIGISWWEEEVPNAEEMRHGYEILKANDWKCDFIISHEAPESDCSCMHRNGGVFAKYLEKIKRATDFKVWYYGHHHLNVSTGDKMQCLFSDILEIGTKKEKGPWVSQHKKEVFNRRELIQLIDDLEKEKEMVLKESWRE